MLPKFNQELRNIVREELQSHKTGAEGIIIKFYFQERTADVMISKPGTERPGELLKNIPVPLTLGIQGMDPVEGQYCFVSFKDGNPRQPFVTAIYATDYKKVEERYHEQVLGIFPRFLGKF